MNHEIEKIEDMTKRLKGTGGGMQAAAVVKAIKLINGAPGALDADNRATALYHLSVALSGGDGAAVALEGAAMLAK